MKNIKIFITLALVFFAHNQLNAQSDVIRPDSVFVYEVLEIMEEAGIYFEGKDVFKGVKCIDVNCDSAYFYINDDSIKFYKYLSSSGGVESDPVFSAHLASSITEEDTARWGATGGTGDVTAEQLSDTADVVRAYSDTENQNLADTIPDIIYEYENDSSLARTSDIEYSSGGLYQIQYSDAVGGFSNSPNFNYQSSILHIDQAIRTAGSNGYLGTSLADYWRWGSSYFEENSLEGIWMRYGAPATSYPTIGFRSTDKTTGIGSRDVSEVNVFSDGNVITTTDETGFYIGNGATSYSLYLNGSEFGGSVDSTEYLRYPHNSANNRFVYLNDNGVSNVFENMQVLNDGIQITEGGAFNPTTATFNFVANSGSLIYRNNTNTPAYNLWYSGTDNGYMSYVTETDVFKSYIGYSASTLNRHILLKAFDNTSSSGSVVKLKTGAIYLGVSESTNWDNLSDINTGIQITKDTIFFKNYLKAEGGTNIGSGGSSISGSLNQLVIADGSGGNITDGNLFYSNDVFYTNQKITANAGNDLELGIGGLMLFHMYTDSNNFDKQVSFDEKIILSDGYEVSGLEDLNSSSSSYFAIALSDSTTELTTANGDSWDALYSYTIDSVRIGVNEPPIGSTLTVDIKKNGTTIFTTPITIDASELTSVTAATSYTLSTTSVSYNDRMNAFVSSAGTTFGGAGLKIYIYYTKN